MENKFQEFMSEKYLIFSVVCLMFAGLVPLFGATAIVFTILGITGFMDCFGEMADEGNFKCTLVSNILIILGCGSSFFLEGDPLILPMRITTIVLIVKLIVLAILYIKLSSEVPEETED
jgi:hypothetical protein